MTNQYRLFGFELSPYSVKVRSYLRYKNIPHEWIVRGMAQMPEFQKYAKLPLVPMVVTPDESVMQDSTPIIENLEQHYPDNPVIPADPTLAFISFLLEEFADEWGNKAMFHYRWRRDVDQESAAARLAREQLGEQADETILEGARKMIRDRMVSRVWFVGSSDETAPLIESEYKELLTLLEAHLTERPYLMGAQPSFADFGLFGQLYECYSDPTPGTLIKEQFPSVTAWIERMQAPKSQGDFESWTQLSDTLFPILREQVASLFLPWSDANARALENGDESFSVSLKGKNFSQQPQKYHRKSLLALRQRYQNVKQHNELKQIMEASGCLAYLDTVL